MDLKQSGQDTTQGPIDVAAIRQAARNLEDGAVSSGYQGNREEIIEMLNAALATELVCAMRYKRHYYTATGLVNEPIKAEFLTHAQEEEEHAGRIAERIVQLNGEPDFNPATISQRSHAEYDECTDIKGMIRANLVAERIAIESYRQMIERIGDTDPTTKHLLIDIMAVEEEHADDMRDLLD
ncbi:MAG: ferritin-like domain-containing protein [Candidimonas sp.]|nr:ferritin-like domain-containing protein [Candidimonas sp.]